MKDRVPQFPGRVTLTPVTGQANTYDMVRADSPTQEGTPLNKNSLLKDTTAALYGLGSDATPDEVFQKISPMIKAADFQVGDIMETIRTDLGDKWLLCNGTLVLRSEYPDLSELYPSDLVYQLENITPVYLNDICYYEGTWVAVGAYNNYPYIYTITDPEGNWTGKQIDTSSCQLHGVYCYKGTWVAVGHYGTEPYAFITTDPKGTWTKNRLTTEGIYVKNVFCYEGTWVAVGSHYSSFQPYIFTTTNPSGTWTQKLIYSAQNSTLQDVYCYKGTWVAVANKGATGVPCIYTTTDPSGTWIAKPINTITLSLKGVYCYEGTWVAVGWSNNSYPYILTTTDPSGTWTENTIDDSDIKVHLQDVYCCNGVWMAVGTSTANESCAYIYTTRNPSGTWTKQRVDNNKYSSYLYCISGNEGTWAAMGNAGNLTTSGAYFPKLVSNRWIELPTISTDGVYDYIKAKE